MCEFFCICVVQEGLRLSAEVALTASIHIPPKLFKFKNLELRCRRLG